LDQRTLDGRQSPEQAAGENRGARRGRLRRLTSPRPRDCPDQLRGRRAVRLLRQDRQSSSTTPATTLDARRSTRLSGRATSRRCSTSTTVVPFRVIRRRPGPHLREPGQEGAARKGQGGLSQRSSTSPPTSGDVSANAGPRPTTSSGQGPGVVGPEPKNGSPRSGASSRSTSTTPSPSASSTTRLTQAKVDENTMEKEGEKIQLGIPGCRMRQDGLRC